MTGPVVLLRKRSLLVAKAPALLLGSVVLFGIAVLLLGLLALDGQATVVTDQRVTVRPDGLAIQAWTLPPLRPDEALEAAFSFPRAPGDAYLLTCTDLERFLGGTAPLGPLEVERGVQAGQLEYRPGPLKFRAETGKTPGDCQGLRVALAWPTGGEAWQANAPQATVALRQFPLDGSAGLALQGLALAAAVLALVAGLALGGRRWLGGYEPVPDEPAPGSTVETLRDLAERSGQWLERTRRYLLVSGVLGVFLWYPVLVPWAWQQGRAGSADPLTPWLLAAGALLFLLALTALWARQLLALDAELVAWRERMAQLREREARFLERLEARR